MVYKTVIGLSLLACSMALTGCGSSVAQTTAATLETGSPAALSAIANAKRGEMAVASWREGFRSGNFDPLISMLDDNVEFRFGIPPWNTVHKGKTAAIQALSDFQRLQIRVTQTPVTPPMFNGYSTTFEFLAEGTVNGNPAKANLLVVFDILNDKIVRMHEYSAPR